MKLNIYYCRAVLFHWYLNGLDPLNITGSTLETGRVGSTSVDVTLKLLSLLLDAPAVAHSPLTVYTIVGSQLINTVVPNSIS